MPSAVFVIESVRACVLACVLIKLYWFRSFVCDLSRVHEVLSGRVHAASPTARNWSMCARTPTDVSARVHGIVRTTHCAGGC